jgi:hypothetical protein
MRKEMIAMRLYSELLRVTLILLVMMLAGLPAFAQKRPSKRPAKRPAPSQAAPGTNCEGVLEVVPRKQVSFTRKRRPAPAVEKPSGGRPEAKTGQKPAPHPAAMTSADGRAAFASSF